MIFVEDKHVYKGEGIYIGRPSVVGNPFTMHNEKERIEVISKYQQYFNDEMKKKSGFYGEISRIYKLAKVQDVHLLCWCAPLACHGDVIKAFLLKYL